MKRGRVRITNPLRPDLIVTDDPELSQCDVAKSLPPKQIWLASFAHFSNDLFNGFLAPLLPLLVAKFDISMASVGLLVMVLSTSNSIIQPLTGILSDRLKRNYFVVFAVLITGIFMSLIGVVTHYYMLIIVLAISGIGTALFHPQAASLVGRIKTERPGFSFSVFSMGGSLGIAIGPIIVIQVVEKWGLSATIYTSILAVVVLFFTFPLLNYAKTPPKLDKFTIKGDSKHAWKIVSFLFFMVVIRASLIIGFHNFMPLYLTSFGASNFLGAASVAVFQICGTAGILTGGYMSNRISPINLLKISFLGSLPFLLIMIHLPAGLSIIFFGTAAFFLFSSIPINIILSQHLLPGKESFISGVMMGFAWGIAGVFALFIGILADWIGLYTTFILMAFSTIIGFILAQFSPEQAKEIKKL